MDGTPRPGLLDLLVGVVALLSAGGESSRALLPAFAGTVLLSSTRGWRKGLTAAAVLIAALAIHSGPSVAATGGSGYAFAGEVLVLLAWGLGAGIAASAALMVAESIEKGGENRSIHSLGRVHRTLGPAKLTDVALGSTLDTERLDPADLARLLEDHEDGMRQYDAVKEGRTVVVGRRPLTVNTAIRTEIRTTVARISRRRELAIRLSRWQPLYSRRDSLLLSEVVRELLINAHIHAADGPVVLSSRLERGQWVVRVSDPGGEVRNRRRGSGFGLAYYRHAVHRLDGRLESGPGLAVLRMPFVRLWSLSGPKGDSPLSAAGLGWSQDGPDMPTRPAS